ncbi:MAG: hypothetical protein CMP20_01770 [Rickettsiales bacterium]|nr:hypothetical protein [Rickettsiales bacterium]
MELKCYHVGEFIRGSAYWTNTQEEGLKHCKTADGVCHVLVTNLEQLERSLDLITESDVWIYVAKQRKGLQNRCKKLSFKSIDAEPMLSPVLFTLLAYQTTEDDN